MFVSVDLIGEKNQVILELIVKVTIGFGLVCHLWKLKPNED